VNPVAVAKPCIRVFLGARHEVRNVRAFVREAVEGYPVADDVVLLASEVAANAVVHTASGDGGTFTVVVRRGGQAVRVEIHDGGSRASPVACAAEAHASSGRGLALVESLAGRWGYLGDRDGRVVWFEVDWPGTSRLIFQSPRNGEDPCEA
jgi:anti-sigma regulatory factor (Ser/Thr protein kinase)